MDTADELHAPQAARALDGAPPRLTVRRVKRVFGPAWIVMLADFDAPSVLTAAKAGTDFGYAMLLPLALLIPILYLVQEVTARLAIGTGLGHAELIRERYGFGWGAVAVGSMVVIDLLAYVAQFAGIALGASLIGIPAGPAVAGALIVHSTVAFTRSYRRFELVAIGLSLALFAFVGLAIAPGPQPAAVLAIAASPQPAAVLAGFSPFQPLDRPGDLSLVVATIGAVIMPWMLFYQQAATVDKGLDHADLPAARAETLTGAVLSEVLMAAVVIATAAAATPAGATGHPRRRPRPARRAGRAGWRRGRDADRDRDHRLGPAGGGRHLAVVGVGLVGAVPLAPQPQPVAAPRARLLRPLPAGGRPGGHRGDPRPGPGRHRHRRHDPQRGGPGCAAHLPGAPVERSDAPRPWPTRVVGPSCCGRSPPGCWCSA